MLLVSIPKCQAQPSAQGNDRRQQKCILPEADREQADQRIGEIEQPGIAFEKQAVEAGEEFPKTSG